MDVIKEGKDVVSLGRMGRKRIPIDIDDEESEEEDVDMMVSKHPLCLFFVRWVVDVQSCINPTRSLCSEQPRDRA